MALILDVTLSFPIYVNRQTNSQSENKASELPIRHAQSQLDTEHYSLHGEAMVDIQEVRRLGQEREGGRGERKKERGDTYLLFQSID